MNNGKKYDAGKPMWAHAPWNAFEQVVEVIDFGAQKYGRNNWKMLPDFENRYLSAALRHIVAYIQNPYDHLDNESGLNHLAHAMTCLAFILEKENYE